MRSTVAAGARHFHPLGNVDPLLQAVVKRDHVLAALAEAEFAHHGGVRPLQDLDDLAVGPPAGLDARDPHDHAVAMHRLARRNRAE